MRHAVLGTGTVGQTIAAKLASRGHEVRMGARDAANEKAAAWAKGAGAKASHGTFADAAAFGEVVWNCTKGEASLEALRAAGAANLRGKPLLDLSNPLDFSKGFPPSLTVCNTDSLAEQLQRAFPEAKVVKTLNTLTAALMVDPARLDGGDHDVFVAGNDAGAKQRATTILSEDFGWKRILDLGDLSSARGTEAWLLLWTRLYGALGHANHNLKIVR
jgi:predicted dinucleotide-binding enzyme